VATPTLSERIYTDLRDRINRGNLRPGDFLPTEAEIIEAYSGISRGTVSKATQRLVNDGLVERIRGRNGGMRVRERVQLTYLASRLQHHAGYFSGADAFFGSTREQGFEPSQEFSCFIVALPAEFADLLDVDPGSPAAVRRCLRKVNGEPISIQDSYYPQWLTAEIPELLSPTDIPIGTTRFLADRGYHQTEYDDRIMCRMPRPEEADLLHLGPGTPVMEVLRLVGLPDGRPTRLGHEVCDGDRYVRRYQLGSREVLS
jgi:GntR family transcriptional regulator